MKANILQLRESAPEGLEERLSALRTRKKQLEEIMRLEKDVVALEMSLLLGKSGVAAAARAITELVAGHYGLPMAAITANTRLERIAFPRQVAMALIRELTGETLAAIGSVFRRDHGTVLCGIRRVDARRETEAAFAAVYDGLKKQCAAKVRALKQ